MLERWLLEYGGGIVLGVAVVSAVVCSIVFFKRWYED